MTATESQAGPAVALPPTSQAGPDDLTRAKSRAPREIIWRQFKRNRGALIGSVLLLALVLATVLAPAISPYDPNAQDADSRLPPSREYLFGTDIFGRDILSRVIYGGRVSLAIGIVAVAIGLTLGTVLGLLAGFYGRHVDAAVVMLADIMLSFPGILLALAIIAILGPGTVNVMVAVGVASIPAYARLVRSSVLTAKSLTYVEAARVVGASNRRIMFEHLLPNVFGPVIVLATLSIATAILTAAGLSFLGLGTQPPTPEWGAMVSDGRQYLRVAWWISTMPGLAIMVSVLAINLIGDGLRDALDPRLRQ